MARYCRACGRAIPEEDAKFCPACGAGVEADRLVSVGSALRPSPTSPRRDAPGSRPQPGSASPHAGVPRRRAGRLILLAVLLLALLAGGAFFVVRGMRSGGTSQEAGVTAGLVAGGQSSTATTANLPSSAISSPKVTSDSDDSGTSMFRGNLERTGVYASGGPSQLNGIAWKFRTGGSLSSPAISGGVVYVGGTPDSLLGYLYAVDTKTGQEKWKFQIARDVYSSPAISGGVVYVGSQDGYLYAVDTKTGQEKWKFQTGDGVASSPAISAGVVYVGSNDGYLYAVK